MAESNHAPEKEVFIWKASTEKDEALQSKTRNSKILYLCVLKNTVSGIWPHIHSSLVGISWVGVNSHLVLCAE